MAESGSEDGDLAGSRLGTHEHWEGVYELELRNLQQHGDEGENWFGEDVLETMVGWTDALLRSLGTVGAGSGAPEQLRILDVGTGNGVLALELARRGYARVTGADYSAAAVRLAGAVAARRGAAGSTWRVDDLLASRLGAACADVLTDKGVLDAVGLRADGAAARGRYRAAAARLLAPRGLLVLTSCNSTLAELAAEFCGRQGPEKAGAGLAERGCAGGAGGGPGGCGCGERGGREAACESGARWEYVDHVRTYPVLRFGGQEGTRVCTVAFRRCGAG